MPPPPAMGMFYHYVTLSSRTLDSPSILRQFLSYCECPSGSFLLVASIRWKDVAARLASLQITLDYCSQCGSLLEVDALFIKLFRVQKNLLLEISYLYINKQLCGHFHVGFV